MTAPKVLGVFMTAGDGHGWDLNFGPVPIRVFGVEPWLAATVCGKYVASSVDWPAAIAAIERELLAIRAAIPSGEKGVK